METWVEISRSSLKHNFDVLRRLCPKGTELAPVVKANAYGHGSRICAEVFANAGATMLCVNEIQEVQDIDDLNARILVVGPLFPHQADAITRLQCDVTVSNELMLEALNQAAVNQGTKVAVHIKVDTGTNRQGFSMASVPTILDKARTMNGIQLVALCTHLSDVEDETTHTFANVQLDRFTEICAQNNDLKRHCASSAVHLLFPDARLDMVRSGISCYGMWPSKETKIASDIVHNSNVSLSPALSWKTRIAQVRLAPRGDYVGYGRTHRCPQDTRIAVLPVGYYDGYDRRLSSNAQVLVRGQRAPVLGRICMNMCMIDITAIPEANVGDEVVLLGVQGEAVIAPQEMAEWMNTIHYEVTTRIQERIPRLLVD